MHTYIPGRIFPLPQHHFEPPSHLHEVLPGWRLLSHGRGDQLETACLDQRGKLVHASTLGRRLSAPPSGTSARPARADPGFHTSDADRRAELDAVCFPNTVVVHWGTLREINATQNYTQPFLSMYHGRGVCGHSPACCGKAVAGTREGILPLDPEA